ncbi:MAG: TraB domain-containing protein, partial [Deltaproteobacteria bacterium]|nr:TraB domain-containing protein [Deltaproteobacteria bacterium]
MENEDIHRVTLDGKEIIVVGTAHVSKESADLVEKVIREERPDAVCVELCRARDEALTQQARWEEMDIFQIIREKRAALLLTQLIMASFQKRIADRFGIV